ncbi:hypothetical protein [Isosphaera pallida]|nr:hypothetical protein [Isosphaera pallida]
MGDWNRLTEQGRLVSFGWDARLGRVEGLEADRQAGESGLS